jgi:DNA-binding MarR family transcriptional regulator
MPIYRELQLDRPIEDIRHEAILSVVRTSNLLSQRVMKLLRRFQLTEAQFNVLFVLKYKQRDLTQADLGSRLVVTRASVTSVLDKLEDKKLVARRTVSGNRRIYHIDLTDTGSALINEVEPLYRENVHEVLTDFKDDDCQALINRLEQIRGHCGEV